MPDTLNPQPESVFEQVINGKKLGDYTRPELLALAEQERLKKLAVDERLKKLAEQLRLMDLGYGRNE